MIYLPKLGIGFGSREVKKSIKGATIAGAGAVAYSILLNVGLMPEFLQGAELAPFVVAGLSVVVNMVRQLITQPQSES